jgi:hypothetical protein
MKNKQKNKGSQNKNKYVPAGREENKSKHVTRKERRRKGWRKPSRSKETLQFGTGARRAAHNKASEGRDRSEHEPNDNAEKRIGTGDRLEGATTDAEAATSNNYNPRANNMKLAREGREERVPGQETGNPQRNSSAQTTTRPPTSTNARHRTAHGEQAPGSAIGKRSARLDRSKEKRNSKIYRLNKQTYTDG